MRLTHFKIFILETDKGGGGWKRQRRQECKKEEES